MPAPGRSKAIFRAALDGDVLTSEDIGGLVRDKVPEDQWLEYKQHWPDPKAANLELRRHVTGFANAEGGLIGINGGESDPPLWDITGLNESAENCTRWAETVAEVSACARFAPRTSTPRRLRFRRVRGHQVQ